MVETTGIGYSPKDLQFGSAGRTKLISGVVKMSRAVKSTLGPGGNTVLIESPHHTHGITVTKDGVTVAKAIDLIDPSENLAVRMMKEAADRTATAAGDGPQPLDSGVLTPNGWVLMGDIAVGDTVCGINGTNQVVLGIFPKGELEIYEIIFGDGRVVECSGNHLWSVTTSYGVKKTITTDRMMEDFINKDTSGSSRYRYFVENTTVDFNSSNDMPIDAYTLGLLLGDGSLSGTSTVELSFGVNKSHLIEKIKLPDGFSLSSKFYSDKNYFRVKINGKGIDGRTMNEILNNIGLLGTLSDTKFIPIQYLYSSIESRTNLLKGLLDTDGYINSRSLFEFSTVSDRLADDFQELISGLGYSFYRKLHTRDNDKDSYSEKSIHRIQQLQGYKYGSKIIDIRKTGITAEMMCIKVSNEDHLYITDGYIPTHNTTTAIVLTEALVLGGLEHIKDDMNRTEVLRQMVDISNKVVDRLRRKAKKVSSSMLLDVASISSNNDREIGRIISEVYKDVGKTGIVTVERSQTAETYAETTKGLKIDRGYLSSLFINDQKKDECVFEDVMVLVADIEIANILQIENVLKPIISEGKKLLIIAPCNVNVVNTLAANVMKGHLKVVAVPPPNFGYKQHELMHDIAVSVGATYYSEKTGDDLSHINFGDLGHAAKVIVGKDKTVIIRSAAKSDEKLVEERVAQLWDGHKATAKKGEKDFFLERIASLTGGIGVIFVGGQTDLEQKELYDRVDDAVCAVRSALEEGILPGAGKALFEESLLIGAESQSSEQSAAIKIVSQALQVPLIQILANAGLKIEDIYKGEVAMGSGYNLKTGKMGDLVQMGVIDPLKVTRCALQNAVSVANTILSTNAIITMARTYEQSQ
jgi:chaperonin GroEL